MYDAVSLLMRAEQLGVKLWVESGDLRYRCRAGEIPGDLLDELGAHRASLLEHLSRTGDAPAEADDLAPTFEHHPIIAGRVRSFRRASWYALKEKLNGVDSTNCRFVVRVRGYLDLDALVFAFEDLRRRHEVLGSTVMDVAGQPWLVFERKTDWEVDRRDVSNLPGAERESAARDVASELVWRTMDVTNGSMFRAFVIALDHEDHVLGFVVHHLITDTISMRILSKDLIRSYSLKTAGHHSTPQQNTLSYSDYLSSSTEWIAQPAVQEKLCEWADRLASAAPMDLVHQPPRAPEPDRACTRYRFEIGAGMTAAVANTARQLRTSKFMVLLTAQKMLLASLTNSDQVTMGVAVSGRELPVLTPVVGYLADRSYWITQLEGDPTFTEAVARVNESYLQATRYRFFRSDMVQDELGRCGKSLHAPIFNFMPYSRPRAYQASGRFSWFEVDAPPFSTIPLPGISYWMALAETPQVMRGDIRFPHGSAEVLVEQFAGTLAMVMKDGTLKLSALRRALRSF